MSMCMIITVLLYSGLSNPMFELCLKDHKSIIDKIKQLPVVDCPNNFDRHRLGYQGLLISNDETNQPIGRIYSGIIRYEDVCRNDVGRRLEGEILDVASPNLRGDQLDIIRNDFSSYK